MPKYFLIRIQDLNLDWILRCSVQPIRGMFLRGLGEGTASAAPPRATKMRAQARQVMWSIVTSPVLKYLWDTTLFRNGVHRHMDLRLTKFVDMFEFL